jgi:hypothetical protein
VRGNAAATVAFTATGFRRRARPSRATRPTSSPGAITGTCTAPCNSINVAGLANGTAYNIRPSPATNAVGTGAASAASNSVTPAAVPSAPTIGLAVRGNAIALGRVHRTRFRRRLTDHDLHARLRRHGAFTGTCIAPCTSINVAGLANGTAYTFTVTATNAAGTGLPSAASNSVTPAAVPGAPTIGLAVRGNAARHGRIHPQPPASDGGSPITGYTATSSPGALTGTCNRALHLDQCGGALPTATAYTFNRHRHQCGRDGCRVGGLE